MKRIMSVIHRRRYLTLFIVAVVIAVIFFVIRQNTPTPVDAYTVHRATVTQIVSVTGKTKPTTDVQLSFEKSGRIIRAPFSVGDSVVAGQVLAELDTTELAAQLAEARASVAVQQAKLDELKQGTRPEDIQVKQTELKKAQQDLANEYQAVFDVLNDAYIRADDAVRKQTDDVFTNDEEQNPQLTFTTIDSQKEIDAETGRFRASTELKTWRNELDALITRATDTALFDNAIAASKKHLLVIRDFMNQVMDAILSASNLSSATASTYKAAITTGRTNVAAAITNVSAQEQAISSQAVVVARISDELALALAGSTPESIASQAAAVAQAEAQVGIVQAQIAKSALRAPIDGVITTQDAKPGETASPNAPLISLISSGKLQIEANIPEADIAKVAIGNTANITFDAYGDAVKFSGTITFIDPAETTIEGVPTYKTTFAVRETNMAIKPGLTANLDIVTAEHANALTIPQRAIIYRDDRKYVRLYGNTGTAYEEREITTGLRGSNGDIEVISGLAEGDRISPLPQ